jgi:ferredoxin
MQCHHENGVDYFLEVLRVDGSEFPRVCCSSYCSICRMQIKSHALPEDQDYLREIMNLARDKGLLGA